MLTLTRLGKFLRSVIPADPAQLLFLIGLVCLLVARGLRWWPEELPGLAYRTDGWLLSSPLGIVIRYLFIFASLAGYFICFRPGRNPLTRIFGLVCLPACIGIGLRLCQFLYVSKPYSSIFDHTTPSRNWGKFLSGLPLAFDVCALGLILILMFASRMSLGIARLPLKLPEKSVLSSDDGDSWNRFQVLAWVLVGPFLIITAFFYFLISEIARIVIPHSRLLSFVPWIYRSAEVLELICVCGVLLWIAGEDGRRSLRSLLSIPLNRYAVAGFAIPIGIPASISLGSYLIDRAVWAAREFGSAGTPQFSLYFQLPDPQLLFFCFAALFEEVIFRGLLQPRFIRRYGIYRGFFLVGIVWAAFHFSSDSSPDWSFTRMLLQLGYRVLMAVVLSFVLGWLTLHSKSIFPAAVAHALFNIFMVSQFGPRFFWKPTLTVVLWGLLAIILFHYWPVHLDEEPSPDIALPEPEPAV